MSGGGGGGKQGARIRDAVSPFAICTMLCFEISIFFYERRGKDGARERAGLRARARARASGLFEQLSSHLASRSRFGGAVDV